ncbi:hypothetical protein RFM26_01585 [Mesorhizobium sp. VK23B]|uniref:Uncharacterized protein n=1 Tax=Mesorhizobium dulcispinae TaxID=3072316 RepID=A0ABU4X8K1_9HYPH|nr:MULTISPECIES: hypothetical protein [unclassified Mesorhizobium]MDX8464377.1 hypothetical protein [Mesorhizobium sp. VK23B]MDX8470763.1 hypothetical protein [Mesorhizobium sp. VK23A]
MNENAVRAGRFHDRQRSKKAEKRRAFPACPIPPREARERSGMNSATALVFPVATAARPNGI